MIIFILVLILIYLIYSRDNLHSNATYVNIDLNEACKKADGNINLAIKLQQQTPQEKEFKTALKKSEEQQQKDKEKANMLYLKHGDKEEHILEYLYYGEDDFAIKGDDKLVYKMYEMGKKNKQAMDIRALYNKNDFKPFIEEELRQHENSIWFEDDTLEYELTN